MIFKIAVNAASANENEYAAAITAMLASPSLNPGIGIAAETGSFISTKVNISAGATNSASNAMRLALSECIIRLRFAVHGNRNSGRHADQAVAGARYSARLHADAVAAGRLFHIHGAGIYNDLQLLAV